MIKLIIHGAGGTMGRVVASLAQKLSDAYVVVAGVDCYKPNENNADFPIYESFDKCKEECDVIIDFSLPDALPKLLEVACARGCALVIATTGLADAHEQQLHAAAAHIPIFVATNMSLGVNLQIDLIKKAASFLGDSFDIEIIEKHHNQKVDAPSGTALTLAKELSSQFPNGKDYVYDRHDSREKRNKREIGLHAVRGGTIVGEHQVLFIGEDEVLEVNHIAQSKRIFAAGALRAASFICTRSPKLYSMNEIMAEVNSVTNVSAEMDQSIITLSGVPHDIGTIADVFGALAQKHINIDMISQSTPKSECVDLAFTLPGGDIPAALEALQAYAPRLKHLDAMAKFCVEGAGMEHKPGIAARVFRALADAGIGIVMVTTSETKISFCIDETDVSTAFDATKKAFDL